MFKILIILFKKKKKKIQNKTKQNKFDLFAIKSYI
jgi:hypothetical protein